MRARLPKRVSMSRRLTFLALALVALLVAAVPAVPAKQKADGPKVRSFSPTKPELGGKLTLLGKGFAKKRSRNTVVLRAPNGGSTFLKPISASKKKLVVRLRSTIERLMAEKSGVTAATRFRVRVLAGKQFGPWTKKKRSPVIQPSGSGSGGADADCDGDGSPNGADGDDDNDLLSDSIETQIKTDVCLVDTDQDGLEDGFEYQSALDLNDDEDQEANTSLPYPGKRPYPNPLDPSDTGKDYDGDSLVLAEEHALWLFAIKQGYAVRTLSPLYYSDGEQYSMITRGSDGRRRPSLPADGYERGINFLNWASSNGYRTVMLDDGAPWYAHETTRNPYGLLDFNRDGGESATELQYYDRDDGFLSDDERDEDADGLSNYDETHGRMTVKWWTTCYSAEKPYNIEYIGTDVVDPDTDGDGVRDGADDQDHDDIPNVMELSRIAASGVNDTNGQECKPSTEPPLGSPEHHPSAFGRMNPFNPCLPATWSRTCPRYVDENTGAPFDGSPNWYSLN